MLVRVALSYLLLLAAGCVTSKPPNAAEFGRIESIRDLEGTYRNRGEGAANSSPVYLSSIIWPKVAAMDHRAIAAVEVHVTGQDTLVVRALGKDGIQKQDTFVEGRDFHFRAGRILIKQSLGVAGFKSGEPLVGPYHESAEIGLDKEGHGRYRNDFSVAGLVYLVIPIAMSGSDEVRFLRIDSPFKP